MSLISRPAIKKLGAVVCVSLMILTIAQTVVSYENRKPIAEAGDDVFVDIGITIGFDGSDSDDEDGTIVNYTWNFQDGLAYGLTPHHAYDTAGIYLVILMVKDDFGDVGFDSLTVVVKNSPPIAVAEVNETAYEDEILVFNGTKSTDNSTDIQSLQYHWDFGDGTVSNESVVNHTYTRSGTYIATLKVTDNDGAMDVDFVTVNVTNLPPICGKGLNKTVEEDEVVSFGPAVFDTISDQPILKSHWDFGDGTATEGRIVEHAYTKSGTYLVTFTATDDDGAQSNDTFYVIVENVDPQVEIKDVVGTIYEGEAHNFEAVGNDTSTDIPLLDYTWSFGKSGWNGSDIWEDDWTGEISCSVVDDDGATGETSKTITVENTDPSVSVVDAYLIGDITLRASGEKWHDVKLYLNESGVPQEELWVYREAGDPKDQEDTEVNVKFALAEESQVTVHYTPLDDPINGQLNGATPVWIILEFDNGAYRKIHHTFNVQQPETWVWNLNLNDYFFLPISDLECSYSGGNPTMHFEYWVFDAGKDDETVTWDFGEATLTQRFGASTFPTKISSTIDYTPIQLQDITVTAVDDDGGSGTMNLYFTSNYLDNIAPKAYASGYSDADEDSGANFYGSGTDTVSDVGSLSYLWNFGDGRTGTGESVTHVYENEGTYMAILEVSDRIDSTFDACFIDIHNVAPSANAGDGQTVYEDDIAILNGSLSSDTLSDKDSLLYSWSFGELGKASGINGECAFSEHGSYEIELTVIDDNGAIDTDTVTLVVENAIPSVEVVENLTMNEDQTAFLSCVGNDSISDKPLLNYNWTFGTSYNATIVNQTVTTTIINVNGTNVTQTNITYNNETITITPYSLGCNPTFIYNQSGIYSPEVNVTDDDGASGLGTANITVVNVPPVAFIGNDMKIFAGIVNISFNATGIDTFSDIDTLEYYWDFGDGNTSEGKDVIHAYTVDGNYTINLTVIDNDGAVANHSINVTVRIDSDGDGMPDVWEILHGLDHQDPTGDNGAEGDPDEDFLVNLLEYYYGLHPMDDDTDDDGILDGNEDANRNGIVDDGETDPLNPDTDGDELTDGLEIGLETAQGQDTAFWQADTDPGNVTDPLDADTDDDGITDGNEDANHNGIRDGTETAPELWDTDSDYLRDGMEIGLTEPQHTDTDINKFVADNDTSTTTDPTNPDCDGDGLLDGEEDFDHNGAIGPTEPDPNDWDSDDDGLADGSGNTVTVLTLTEVVNTARRAKTISIWVNGTTLPHVGYAVPDTGDWLIAGQETTVIDETIAVAFFLNEMPITILSGMGDVNYSWIPDAEGPITVKVGSLTLSFSSEKVNYTFPDPDPATNDTDGDGIKDFVEAMYLSGRVRDFRTNNTDGDECNRTLLDNSTVYNNLVDPDSDNDGLNDSFEWVFNSDMLRPDSEYDGIGDFEEFIEGTNPIDPDTDWDGLSDYEELRFAGDGLKTNATNPDTDNDGLYDGWADSSHDMIYDDGEDLGEAGDLAQPIWNENRNKGGYGTNATLTDTDGDELPDGAEVDFWQEVYMITSGSSQLRDIKWNSDFDDDGKINLLDSDSDNDNIMDGPEKAMWESYPNITAPGWQNDPDGDRWINIIDQDSDNEGLLDGVEMLTYETRADYKDSDGDAYGYASYSVGGKRFSGSNYHFNDYTEIEYWINEGGYSNITAGAYANTFDVDIDTMKDGWEAYYDLLPDDDTGDHGANGDFDWDGLTNLQEYIPNYNMYPNDADYDNDGLYDGFNDANHDGIWNDLNSNGLWDVGEEEWGEIGDPDNSFVGGYGTSSTKKDTDGDRWVNTHELGNPSAFTKDGEEISYWLAKDHRTENRKYNSIEAGQKANTFDADGDSMRDGFEVLFAYMEIHNQQNRDTIKNVNQPIPQQQLVKVMDPDDPEDDPDPDQDGLKSWEEHAGWDVRIDYRTGNEYHVWSHPHVNNWDLDGFDDSDERDYDSTRVSPDPFLDFGTDPWNDDTDGDTLKDSATSEPHALDPDSDDDGLSDYTEYHVTYGGLKSSQTNPETDGDGLWDGWHDTNKDMDYDAGEILGERGEIVGGARIGGFGTWPTTADHDGDGFYDGWDDDGNYVYDAGEDWGEIGDPANSFAGSYGSDALKADTDGDGLNDRYEQVDIDNRLNQAPLNTDGLPDGDNLHDPDSDEDGLWDGWIDTWDFGTWESSETKGEVGSPTQSFAGGYRSDSRVVDTDNDNLDDGDEAQYWDDLEADAWSEQYDGGSEISNLRDPDADGDTWLDGDEYHTYKTKPETIHSDTDTVPDNLDIDPLVDLVLTLDINEFRSLDLTEPDIYFNIWFGPSISTDIWHDTVEVRGWSSDSFTDWRKDAFNIPDDQEWVDILIQAWDDEIGGPFDVRQGTGYLVGINYNLRTGQWQGDDSQNDPNGYGHCIGSGDANMEDRDGDIWFDITQTDYDGDGLTWWEEVNVYRPLNPDIDPTVRNMDTDDDRIPDWWEDKYGFDLNDDTDAGLDATLDDDGLTNLEEFWCGRPIPTVATGITNANYISQEDYEFGGHPRFQDIFVEVDWMTGHEMSDDAQHQVIKAFAEHDIHLWIDDGWMGGGNQIAHNDRTGFAEAGAPIDFYDYKNGQDTNGNGVIDPNEPQPEFDDNRNGIFHYCIFAHRRWNTESTGVAWANEDDFLVADDHLSGSTQQAGTFMHELGHNLGLTRNANTIHPDGVFAGIDTNFGSTYLSCMNYDYQLSLVDYSDGPTTTTDHDDWGTLNLPGINRWNTNE